VSESKRFHKLYDFEDAAVQDVETIVVPGSEQKTHDYPVPSFTIFYDILPYATIDTYRNDFPPLNLKNQSWMFRPIITTDQAHLVTPQSQHTQTDVHSRLLRYSIEITKEKQTEVYTRKSKIHSLGLNKVKVSPPLTQSPSKWTNSIKRLGTMRNFVDVTKKATEKHVSVQNTFGLKLPEPTVNFAFALKPSKSKSFLSPNK
jgi:hypothetical protein